VLGNHDLHLLACALGRADRLRPGDTLDEVLAAPDRAALLDWLRTRPLLHHDAALGFTLVHAGLPPLWDLATAQQAARQVQEWLGGPDHRALLDGMYGNRPGAWAPDMDRPTRCRFTINALTRLRFCHHDGRLDFAFKGDLAGAGSTLVAWFDFPGRRSRDLRLVFGHWSTLRLSPAEAAARGAFHLDTGCVWGGALSALRLDDLRYFQVASQTRTAFD
jgi:bis(5'-nucleosyl)-tetraphosphatase (symmetrical)